MTKNDLQVISNLTLVLKDLLDADQFEAAKVVMDRLFPIVTKFVVWSDAQVVLPVATSVEVAINSAPVLVDTAELTPTVVAPKEITPTVV